MAAAQRRSAAAKRIEELASEPTTAKALAKLIYYSAAMIVTPLVTYNLSMTRFVPYLYEKYGTELSLIHISEPTRPY